MICDIVESYFVGPVLYVEIKIKWINRHKFALFSKKQHLKEFEILSLKFSYADRMLCYPNEFLLNFLEFFLKIHIHWRRKG